LGLCLKVEHLGLLGEDWDAAPKITEETTDEENHLFRTVFCPATLQKIIQQLGFLSSVPCS